MKPTERKDIVLSLIESNLDDKKNLTKSKTDLSRILVKEHPELFKTIENARSCIRYYTATIGKKNRNAPDIINVSKKLPNILVFDIETLPMWTRTWTLFKPRLNPDNIIKDWCVLSWAAKWLHEDEIYGDILTVEETKTHDDKRILKTMWDFLDDADVVIAHNGDLFDIKKLNARFKELGMYPPSPYRSIDTLKNSLKTARHSSHKLDYLTKKQGQDGKNHTDYSLWVDCDNGNAEALAEMFVYNKKDVSELEEYYLNNRAWMPSHPTAGMYWEGDEPICPACASQHLSYVGEKVNAVTKRPVFRCDDCGHLSYKSAKGMMVSMNKL